MPRGPRLDAPGTLHHVMVRGIEGRNLFEMDRDRQDFVDRLAEVVLDGEARCLAWALLPNHTHMLLRTGRIPLAKMMRRLLTGYAVSFNLRHARSGHLFQNRYRSIVCEEDPYLLELVRYIHLNPVRAGVVPDVSQLGGYPWSGHAVVMGKTGHPWQAREEILDYFGGPTAKALRKYRTFIAEGMKGGKREDLRAEMPTYRPETDRGEGLRRKDGRVLGSTAFLEKVLGEAERASLKRLSLKGRQVDLEELIARVCRRFRISREELLGGGRRRDISLGRSVFCSLASKEAGLTGRDLAQLPQL
jgi:putative transposase